MSKIKPNNHRLLLFVLIVLLVVIGFAIWWRHNSSPNPLPLSIKDQINFQALFPTSSAYYKEPDSYQYNAESGVLSYLVTHAQTQIVITEQILPPNFAVPTSTVGQFDTKPGRVFVTNVLVPESSPQPGKAAILISRQTLVTAAANQPLTNQAWQQFYDTFKAVR